MTMAMPGALWALTSPSVIIQFPIVPRERPGDNKASHLWSLVSIITNTMSDYGHTMVTLPTNNLDIRHMGMGLSCPGWEPGCDDYSFSIQ